MEALPDLKTLSDADLRDLIRTLQEEEQQVSYRRRLLHGKIDILRAELVRGSKGRWGREEPAGRGRARRPDRDSCRQGGAPIDEELEPSARSGMTHLHCPECGFQNPEAAQYCAKCGALLIARRGRALDDDDRARRTEEDVRRR